MKIKRSLPGFRGKRVQPLSCKFQFNHQLTWLLICSLLLIVLGCSTEEKSLQEDGIEYDLKIYTHQAMLPLLEKTLPLFEEENYCTVIVESTEEARHLADIAAEGKGKTRAGVILGISNCNLAWALDHSLAQPYEPAALSKINEEYYLDTQNRFIPYSYAYYAFIYDSFAIETPPETFGKLQDGIWKNNLLVSDPRSSTNGLGFLLWSVSMFGENGFGHFWRSIKNNVFMVTPLWEDAFSLFLSGETPMVLGFTTTPAYFFETEDRERYKSFIPKEGAFRFIEGIGILTDSKNLSLAQKFVDFVLSSEFQQHLPHDRLMYPVNENVSLPASFKTIERPDNVVKSGPDGITHVSRIENWIDRWERIMID